MLGTVVAAFMYAAMMASMSAEPFALGAVSSAWTGAVKRAQSTKVRMVSVDRMSGVLSSPSGQLMKFLV